MLSETEHESVQKAIDCLNRALDSLLAQYRAGVIDIHQPVVAVTEALEHLEEIFWPSYPDTIEEWEHAEPLSLRKLPR